MLIAGYFLGKNQTSQTENYNTVSQNFMNSITNQVNQQCIVDTDIQVTGNIVSVDGTNITGNFTGINNNGAQVNANCAITSVMNNNVSSVMQAIAQQENSTSNAGFLSGLFSSTTDQSNINNVTQNISTQINNINSALCSVNTNVNTSGNFVFVNQSNVSEDFVGINIAQTDVTSACNMNNLMKNVIYEQSQSSDTQGNVTKTMIQEVFIIIAVIIIVIVVAPLLAKLITTLFVKKPDPAPVSAPVTNPDGTVNKPVTSTNPDGTVNKPVTSISTVPSLPSTVPSASQTVPSLPSTIPSSLPSVPSTSQTSLPSVPSSQQITR